MTKINPSDYSSSRPKLEPDDLEGDFTILTIAATDNVDVDDDEKESGTRKSLVMTFSETGDKALWLNVTQIKSLVAGLGDDSDKWPGQKVPVEKVVTQFKGKKYPKVAVMDHEEWEDAFKKAGMRKKSGVAKAR